MATLVELRNRSVYQEARIIGLSDGERISIIRLVVWHDLGVWQTDGQTDILQQHRPHGLYSMAAHVRNGIGVKTQWPITIIVILIIIFSDHF